MSPPLLPVNATARDVLEYVAGPGHALHSVTDRKRQRAGMIEIDCSCGERFKTEGTDKIAHALRNVRTK